MKSIIIEATNKEVLGAHEALTNLSQNADVPDFSARYAIAQSHEKLKPVVDCISKEDRTLIEKYFNKIENGRATDLKSGTTQEDFNQEREKFLAEEIEVEVYLITLSSLRNVTIFITNENEKQERINLPAVYLTTLKKWLVDDLDVKNTVEKTK
jgi:hypothetical protein